MKKAFLNWSSGKDAAYALYLLQKSGEYSVEKLVTTIDSSKQEVTMHKLPVSLLELQAQKTGITLDKIYLDGNASVESYNLVMQKKMEDLGDEGFTHAVYGDIFLEDLKDFRKQQLQKVGLEAVFPLWKKNTSQLIDSMIRSGFKAIVVSVNAKVLDKSFCGRIIDHAFIKDLPSNVDPCGENGEFHSFVFGGPIFSSPITFQKGEISEAIFNAPVTVDADAPTWDTHFWNLELLPG